MSRLACTLGVLSALASSVFTVAGMALQKLGIAKGKGKLNPVFLLGLFFFVVCKPAAQFLALYCAPVALVAPLQSATILLNSAAVPWLSKQQLTQRDCFATAALVLGCVGTTVAGPHETPELHVQTLLRSAEVHALATLLLIVALGVVSALLFRPQGSALPVFVAAVAPSCASALNNVWVKVMMVTLGCGIGALQESLAAQCLAVLVLALVAASAVLQVWTTTRSLEFFPLREFVPIQTALQVLLATAYGLLFFGEVPASAAVFAGCTLLIAAGVLLFAAPGGKEPEDLREDLADKVAGLPELGLPGRATPAGYAPLPGAAPAA